MVNTIFKGDIAEVSWGKETGLIATGDTTTDGWASSAPVGNTSLITIGSDAPWVATGPVLLIPENALVGCVMTISAGGNFASDDFATTRRTYYIIASDQSAGTITVQPALVSGTAIAAANDVMKIHSIRCPTFDSATQVRTDQFFGLLDSFSLPEPEIDVRQQHIIGMGRDVNVLTSGKETLAGGSMSLNAHTLRWLKYALGGVSSRSNNGELSHATVANTILTARPLHLKDAVATLLQCTAQVVGATGVDTITAIAGTAMTGLGVDKAGKNLLIGLTSSTHATPTSITLGAAYTTVHDQVSADGGIFKHVSTGGALTYGSYTELVGANVNGCLDIDTGAVNNARTDGTLALLPAITASIAIDDIRVKVGTTTAAKFTAGEYIGIIDKNSHSIPGADATLPTVFKHEIRRVIAAVGDYVYVEEPFLFAHTLDECGVERLSYLDDDKRGSPHIDSTTKELKNGVSHTMFGGTRLPTFMIEQSFRSTDESPGTNQLLRLYNGCKIESATVNANSEGELKMDLSYEATRHYTDTGGDMVPHRMFETTANTAANRKVSGIAVNGEKPYLFQDISIEVFGAPVLRGTQFEFQITNGNEARHYIRGYEGSASDSDHVQLGSTSTAFEITESKRAYAFRFSAIVEDDRLWEQVRTRKHHLNSNDIVLRLKKRGSHATRESATITLEDYTIVKADHQVPDDKGAVIVEVDLLVRHLKVEENSPYLAL
jgi:hypothetical protein